MASDDIVQEEKVSVQGRRSGSSNDSLDELIENTNSQHSNCSKSSSLSGSVQFNYSSDFHDNASKMAMNGSKNSICSEDNNCGTSQKYYYEDFHSDSFDTYTTEESGSYIIPLPQEPETKERNLPEQIKKNDVHTKGGKTLPKKKPQQKNILITGQTVNAQAKNNMTCRLLSAMDIENKELKNKASVLQNKMETLILENKMLKHLETRHLKAIRKYQNAEINLPDLLMTQSNKMRTLREHLRKSQEEERKSSKKLREIEVQFLKTRDDLQTLKKLCEDKKLEERGELQCKLTSRTQKLEASERRTQILEKQLSLNTASFRRQLAVEEKKIIEAQSNRANLQVEMESLKQKLKERERELSITNIYAHRIRKGHPEKEDSFSSPKVVKVSKSIQVNIIPKSRIHRKPEPEVHPSEFHEESKANKEVEELFNMTKTLAPETEFHLPEKLPRHNTLNRTFMGLQSEEICPSVEKNIERPRNRRERQGLDLLKAEFENLEKEPAEKQKNKEDKEAKEAVCDILTTVVERRRTPPTSKKEYVFSEAVQNLHRGYPSTGPKITHSRRPRNRQQGDIVDLIGDSVNNYEPSFAKFPKEKQKETPSTPSEEDRSKVLPEKERLFFEKLFGSNCVMNSSDPNSDLNMEGKGEKNLCPVKKRHDEV
ncbi:lebercilin-like protein [Erythrolamprus reginae]|uniref:lebercilin-like protein n=1 Tax=Erythrolamprus reginae TaxID=121349 RepID=UPI00396C3950